MHRIQIVLSTDTRNSHVNRLPFDSWYYICSGAIVFYPGSCHWSHALSSSRLSHRVWGQRPEPSWLIEGGPEKNPANPVYRIANLAYLYAERLEKRTVTSLARPPKQRRLTSQDWTARDSNQSIKTRDAQGVVGGTPDRCLRCDGRPSTPVLCNAEQWWHRLARPFLDVVFFRTVASIDHASASLSNLDNLDLIHLFQHFQLLKAYFY